MKREVLITITYIAEIEDETPSERKENFAAIRAALDKRFPRRMKINDKIHANLLQSGSHILDAEHGDCTKCTACGSWITDKTKTGQLTALASGAYVNDKIYCPQCSGFVKTGAD